jgi:hypothetical protein
MVVPHSVAMKASLLLIAAASCVVGSLGSSMPLPWTAPLTLGASGTSVFLLQTLLQRQPGFSSLPVTSTFDQATANAVKRVQLANALAPTGVLDAGTASAVLDTLAADSYRDDGEPPSSSGKMFKLLFNVPRNRSVEAWGSLIGGNGTVLHQFTARLHGVDAQFGENDDYDTGCPPSVWPAFTDTPGLNEFSPCGNTPTGLSLADLNSPEDDPKTYGPYPVVRMVQGVVGNSAALVPGIRDGILVHTGEWPGWNPPEPMPNSEGCIHVHPQDLDTITHLLVDIGVQIRNNTNGKLPYPYTPQGYISVVQIN